MPTSLKPPVRSACPRSAHSYFPLSTFSLSLFLTLIIRSCFLLHSNSSDHQARYFSIPTPAPTSYSSTCVRIHDPLFLPAASEDEMSLSLTKASPATCAYDHPPPQRLLRHLQVVPLYQHFPLSLDMLHSVFPILKIIIISMSSFLAPASSIPKAG